MFDQSAKGETLIPAAPVLLMVFSIHVTMSSVIDVNINDSLEQINRFCVG